MVMPDGSGISNLLSWATVSSGQQCLRKRKRKRGPWLATVARLWGTGIMTSCPWVTDDGVREAQDLLHRIVCLRNRPRSSRTPPNLISTDFTPSHHISLNALLGIRLASKLGRRNVLGSTCLPSPSSTHLSLIPRGRRPRGEGQLRASIVERRRGGQKRWAGIDLAKLTRPRSSRETTVSSADLALSHTARLKFLYRLVSVPGQLVASGNTSPYQVVESP